VLVVDLISVFVDSSLSLYKFVARRC
jgi:hypothetical protein